LPQRAAGRGKGDKPVVDAEQERAEVLKAGRRAPRTPRFHFANRFVFHCASILSDLGIAAMSEDEPKRDLTPDEQAALNAVWRAGIRAEEGKPPPREPIMAPGGGYRLLYFFLMVALGLAVSWFMRAVIPPIFG
jgi:hypothetical protein